MLLETGLDLKKGRLPDAAHHVFQYLHLARKLGAEGEPLPPTLAVTEQEVAGICERFKADVPTRRRNPLIGINAGAEYGPAKRWPKERFIETATAYTKEHPCDWWVFGGQNDRPLAAEIARAIQGSIGERGKATSLAGETSLRELCSGLKALDALLTNDSGPMHVAAALGTPVVAVFGSTNPELTGPGLPGKSRHQLLRQAPACAPCFLRECPVDLRCLAAVSSESAVQALRRVLSGV
ncbi:MAG TPA: lipopolysaccharide heptosyltransferase II [Verrucomicrobiales bacterium]|nr:lipopolysaccharide heptosyltransferase II [Verrucomicrobiales bacterium]